MFLPDGLEIVFAFLDPRRPLPFFLFVALCDACDAC